MDNLCTSTFLDDHLGLFLFCGSLSIIFVLIVIANRKNWYLSEAEMYRPRLLRARHLCVDKANMPEGSVRAYSYNVAFHLFGEKYGTLVTYTPSLGVIRFDKSVPPMEYSRAFVEPDLYSPHVKDLEKCDTFRVIDVSCNATQYTFVVTVLYTMNGVDKAVNLMCTAVATNKLVVQSVKEYIKDQHLKVE